MITEAIGDGWVTDLSQLRRLLPLADDAAFRDRFREAKQAAKERFADWLKATTGQVVDPQSIFDSQIKRIHEYKRQLLNVLHVVVLYNRLRANPNLTVPPRTFFFAGKAAPAYRLAKLIIKLINNVGRVIDDDPAIRGRIKVVFLPNYNVSLAERLIPASDVSEQISTAGYEASGTGNMKFMMNGALTIGTRDGATIEMAEEAGEENFFLFGLTAEQVQNSRGWYSPRWHYENEPETRRCARPDLQRSLQPRRAGHLRADPRDAAGARRLLHAPGRPDVVRPGAAAARRAVRRSRRLDPQGDHQRGLLRQVLQRSHDRRIRGRHLERDALPGGVRNRTMEYQHVTLRDRGDVLTVYFKQDSILDQQVIDEIGHEFNRVALEAGSCRKLLLNFQHVKFMSSAMISKLLVLNKRCTADKIKLKVSSMSPSLLEVFKITKLNKVFDIQLDEATALAAFEKRGFFS